MIIQIFILTAKEASNRQQFPVCLHNHVVEHRILRTDGQQIPIRMKNS